MASKEKPQYQPWNEEEFQADVFVRGMTWLQRHLYRTLLQASFFHSTRPYLPNDDEVLWVLSGSESLEMWQAHKARILKRFQPCEHDATLLENKRVTADWFNWKDVRDEAVESGRDGGRASAEKRREKYGTAQPVRVLTPEGGSKAPFEGGSGNAEGSRRPPEASEVKTSQDKISEAKINQNPVAGGVGSFGQEPKSMGEWKNLAIRYRNVFGKKAGAEFKSRYAEACSKYTESVVLECFEGWATPGTRVWCEANGFDRPLNLFFKKLPDEAADTVELNNTMAAEKEKAVVEKQKAEKSREESIERQTKEHNERFARTPVVNEMSAADFMESV